MTARLHTARQRLQRLIAEADEPDATLAARDIAMIFQDILDVLEPLAEPEPDPADTLDADGSVTELIEMLDPVDAWFRQQARAQCGQCGGITIDDDASVGRQDEGAEVLAWVWVPMPAPREESDEDAERQAELRPYTSFSGPLPYDLKLGDYLVDYPAPDDPPTGLWRVDVGGLTDIHGGDDWDWQGLVENGGLGTLVKVASGRKGRS